MQYATCAQPFDAFLEEGVEYGKGFDPFFPKRGETAKALKVARAMCDVCPVRLACTEHRRLTGSRFGIWAGEIHNPDKEQAEAKASA